MFASLGRSIALATYAQAALDGKAETLDWRANPWFDTADYRFGMGEPGGPIAAEDPNDWFAALRVQGFRTAALFVEPFGGSWDTIMHDGFPGGQRIAPVTTLPDGTTIMWREILLVDRRTKVRHAYRGGFQVMPGQERVQASKAEAAVRLDSSLAEMVRFQKAHRPDEPHFSKRLNLGRHVLQNASLAPESLWMTDNDRIVVKQVRSLFPSMMDPTALALVTAVEAAWIFGGVGSWNDWDTGSEGFQEVTFPYYEALLAALSAACEPSAL